MKNIIKIIGKDHSKGRFAELFKEGKYKGKYLMTIITVNTANKIDGYFIAEEKYANDILEGRNEKVLMWRI